MSEPAARATDGVPVPAARATDGTPVPAHAGDAWPAAGEPGGGTMQRVEMSGGRAIVLRSHTCFVCGQLNTHGLRLALHVEDGTCWSEPVIDPRFNGWEGITHGGILCALLDEVMAWSLLDEDCWGFTARLAVDFVRPVAVGRQVRVEGHVVDRRRRVFRTEGRIVDPATGETYATAEAVYVDAPPERREEMKRRYEFRFEGGQAPHPAASPAIAPAGNGGPGGEP